MANTSVDTSAETSTDISFPTRQNRSLRISAALAACAFSVAGCAAVSVVDTAVSVTADVVETGVSATTSVVGGAVDVVTGDDD
ncbi:MAG: hypothetical protein AAFV62_09705 [Pseudomonadota bacterium]